MRRRAGGERVRRRRRGRHVGAEQLGDDGGRDESDLLRGVDGGDGGLVEAEGREDVARREDDVVDWDFLVVGGEVEERV